VKRSPNHSSTDREAVQPDALQLSPSDNTVLPARNRCDQLVPIRWWV